MHSNNDTKFIRALNLIFSQCVDIFVVQLLHIVRNLPGDPTNYRVLKNNAVTAMGVVKGVIKSHQEAKDSNSNDFIDSYLKKIKDGKEPTCTGKIIVAHLLERKCMIVDQR